MSSEERDIQLWAYIDGNCSDAERQHIELLIANDKVWAEQYEELRSFNASLINDTETEQPSLRFSQNVMDTIKTTQVAPAAKTYINPWVMKGFAFFFVVLLIGVGIYSLSHMDWSNSAASIKINERPLEKIFSGNFFTYAILTNIVLAVILLDFVLRRKRSASH